jgi:glycogen synthase
MAAWVPVVATAVGGVPELVEDGKTGLLAPSGDAEHLAAHLLRLSDDVSLGARLAELGRRRVETHFSEDRMINGYVAIYEAMLGDATAAEVPCDIVEPSPSSNGSSGVRSNMAGPAVRLPVKLDSPAS